MKFQTAILSSIPVADAISLSHVKWTANKEAKDDTWFIYSAGPTGVGKSRVANAVGKLSNPQLDPNVDWGDEQHEDPQGSEAYTILIDDIVQRSPLYKKTVSAALLQVVPVNANPAKPDIDNNFEKFTADHLGSVGVCENGIFKATKADYIQMVNGSRDYMKRLKEKSIGNKANYNAEIAANFERITATVTHDNLNEVERMTLFKGVTDNHKDIACADLVKIMNNEACDINQYAQPEVRFLGYQSYFEKRKGFLNNAAFREKLGEFWGKQLEEKTALAAHLARNQLHQLYFETRVSSVAHFDSFNDNVNTPSHTHAHRLTIFEATGEKVSSGDMHKPVVLQWINKENGFSVLAKTIGDKKHHAAISVLAKFDDVLQRNFGRAGGAVEKFLNPKQITSNWTEELNSLDTEGPRLPGTVLDPKKVQYTTTDGKKSEPVPKDYFDIFEKISKGIRDLATGCYHEHIDLKDGFLEKGDAHCLEGGFEFLAMYENQNSKRPHPDPKPVMYVSLLNPIVVIVDEKVWEAVNKFVQSEKSLPGKAKTFPNWGRSKATKGVFKYVQEYEQKDTVMKMVGDHYVNHGGPFQVFQPQVIHLSQDVGLPASQANDPKVENARRKLIDIAFEVATGIKVEW